MRESIFHKLVSDENEFTQLLRNLLVRSDEFRRRVLSLFLGEEKASQVPPNKIETQVLLRKFGRPDIRIDARGLCLLLEVKVDARCGLTGYQKPLTAEGKPGGYAGFLLKECPAEERLLAFLAPDQWYRRGEGKDIERQLAQLEQQFAIKTGTVTWEKLLHSTAGISPRDEFVEEFRALLNERFGPITFSSEETLLLKEDFVVAYRTARKVERLVDKISTRAAGYKSESSTDNDLYGVHFRNADNKQVLWFGIWPKFSEGHRAYPLCFGTQYMWMQSVEGLEESFRAGCNSTPIEFEDGPWRGLVVGINFPAEGAEESIWSQLEPALKSILGTGH
ncbi:MAG: hypothetical protein ACRD5K_14125 [Candidatus Acidiferrales bacterium]